MIAERPVAKERPTAPVETPEAAPKSKSRVLGVLFGVFLFFYASSHALPGMVATANIHGLFLVWLGTAGWFVAAGSMVLAAYGLWGFPGLTKRWRMFAGLGSLASLALLAGSGQWSMWPMMVIDGALLSLVVDSTPLVLPRKKRGILKRGWFALVQLLAVAFWLYGAAAIALRPWYQNWGATDAEIAKNLPGDKAGTRIHHINHVVTVDASPEKVWPWLVQLGQDKAGFYSYDALERAFGARIRNVFEIRPEWQHLKAGDFVRACPQDYMGGRFKDPIGWKVLQVEPNHLVLLENWGPFWLEPTADGKTRFGVRSEIGDVPFWAAPIEVFGFEPAHFIMEQKMLLTIKALAERA